MNRIIEGIYNKNVFLLEGNLLNEKEKAYYQSVTSDMEDTAATWALHKMSEFLFRYYGKKVIREKVCGGSVCQRDSAE